MFLSFVVLVVSGFFMFSGTASASILPYVTPEDGHNLYIYPVDNSNNLQWGGYGTTTGAINLDDGSANTIAIVNALSPGIASTTYAAGLCSDLNFGGYTDWYLPAKNQLIAMHVQQSSVNKTSYSDSPNWVAFTNGAYWSSTEISDSSTTSAYMYKIGDPYNLDDQTLLLSGFKNGGGLVRCVRSNTIGEENAAIFAVNNAADVSAMSVVLADTSTTDILALGMTTYTALTNKVPVQTALLVHGFTTTGGVKTVFDNAVALEAAIEAANVQLALVAGDQSAYITAGGTTTDKVYTDVTSMTASVNSEIESASTVYILSGTGYLTGYLLALTNATTVLTNTITSFDANHTATVDVVLTAPEDDNEPTNIGPTAEKFAQDIESGFITVQGDNPAATEKITFNESYTIINGDSRVVIPAGTEMTNSEGGTMDLTEMTLEDITDSIRSASVGTIAGAVSVGIPDLKLSFSQNINVSIPVGSSYNGQTLDVYYQNEGEDNWNSGLTCIVADGLCVFQTNHATEYSAGDKPISGSGDTEDEPDRAKDISWKAEKYTDSNKSCSERLKLTIKGKNFDKDAEVSIGGKEASAVNVKNSKELTAKFCLKKLLNDKVDQKRKITVKNPDTKKGEANKQIDLRDLTSGNEVAVANNTSVQSSSGGDYDQKTEEGAKQIQEALNKLGYLDAENITSTFGSITMEAVKKFQSDNGIDATGFVGELTMAKLAEKIR